MSQYNTLSDIQYARSQILPVDLRFGLFWSAGIPTLLIVGKYSARDLKSTHQVCHYINDKTIHIETLYYRIQI